MDVEWINDDDEVLSSEVDGQRNRRALISMAMMKMIRTQNRRLAKMMITKIRMKVFGAG